MTKSGFIGEPTPRGGYEQAPKRLSKASTLPSGLSSRAFSIDNPQKPAPWTQAR
jgi:hypothetical protein